MRSWQNGARGVIVRSHIVLCTIFALALCVFGNLATGVAQVAGVAAVSPQPAPSVTEESRRHLLQVRRRAEERLAAQRQQASELTDAPSQLTVRPRKHPARTSAVIEIRSRVPSDGRRHPVRPDETCQLPRASSTIKLPSSSCD